MANGNWESLKCLATLRTLQIICLAFRGGVECAGPSDLAEALCEISAAEIEFSK